MSNAHSIQRNLFRRLTEGCFVLLTLFLMGALLSGCVTTNWEKSEFADKRVLVLEEDIQTEVLLAIGIKAYSGQKFILKFEDEQDNYVYVGEAVACPAINDCALTSASLIVPKDNAAGPWKIIVSSLADRGATIVSSAATWSKWRNKLMFGEKGIVPEPIKHRVEIVE